MTVAMVTHLNPPILFLALLLYIAHVPVDANYSAESVSYIIYDCALTLVKGFKFY